MLNKEKNVQPTSKSGNDAKPIVLRSHMAGMMQGFRILQSFMSFQQQKEFGFTENDGKINQRLEDEAERWFKDNYA